MTTPTPLLVRPARADDCDPILAVAQASGLFPTEEIAEIADTTDDFLAGRAQDDRWAVGQSGDDVIALGYYAPERMTRGTWNLYLLAVHPDRQGQGHGATMVRSVEAELRSLGARLLLIETSGTAEFTGQRAFYSGLGYRQEATIADFYDVGDDKVVYARTLTDGPAGESADQAPLSTAATGAPGRSGT